MRINVVALFGKILAGKAVTNGDVKALEVNLGKLAAYIDKIQFIDKTSSTLRSAINSYREAMDACRENVFQKNPIFAQLMKYSYYKIGTTYVEDSSYFLMHKVSQELAVKRLQGMSFGVQVCAVLGIS